MTKSIFAVVVAAVLAVTSSTAVAAKFKEGWTSAWAQGQTEYIATNAKGDQLNLTCGAPDTGPYIGITLANGKGESNYSDGAVIRVDGYANQTTTIYKDETSRAAFSSVEAALDWMAKGNAVEVKIGNVSGKWTLKGFAAEIKDHECLSSMI